MIYLLIFISVLLSVSIYFNFRFWHLNKVADAYCKAYLKEKKRNQFLSAYSLMMTGVNFVYAYKLHRK